MLNYINTLAKNTHETPYVLLILTGIPSKLFELIHADFLHYKSKDYSTIVNSFSNSTKYFTEFGILQRKT